MHEIYSYFLFHFSIGIAFFEVVLGKIDLSCCKTPETIMYLFHWLQFILSYLI